MKNFLENKKVAIVHDFLVKLGGAENVVKKLMEMFPEAPVYTLLYDEEMCGEEFPKLRVRPSFLQKMPKFWRKRYQTMITLNPYAIEALDLSEYDLVISSSGAFSHGVLTRSDALHICYCHSPMRYAWDYVHQYIQERKAGGIKRHLMRRAVEKVRLWDKMAADRPDYYIANSKHVAARINKFYRLPSEVIYPPVATDKFSAGKTGDYFVLVATLTPFKKIDLAVSLFNKIGKRLVVIGGGPEKDYLRSIAGPTVEILGRISNNELKEYLENCRAMIFVAEEDFGIAMVEALSCGKPVLAYGKGGAREIVTPGVNGELFEEQTIASMEDALGRLIVNETKYNAKKIRKDSEKFSDKEFERKLMGFIEAKIAK